eukprot:TRINITY_DN22188_c0_g1_i1.p1 TRINITY_DN22188_c0_g1~~TRINITY_DN22188_c0_g1_i1.p1  ORF type:complete len:294 (+),score=11.52 TRINITY_DN22188_c0_g1_i1:17-898(+)
MTSTRCLLLILVVSGLRGKTALRCRTGRGGDGGTRLDHGEVECNPSSEGTSKGAVCRAFFHPGIGNGEYWQTCDYVYLNQQLTPELARFNCADYMNPESCCIGSDGYKVLCYPTRNVTWLPGEADFYNCNSLCPGVTTTSTTITVTRTSASTTTSASATQTKTNSSAWSRTTTTSSMSSTTLATKITLTPTVTSSVSSISVATTASTAVSTTTSTSSRLDAMTSFLAARDQSDPQTSSPPLPDDHDHPHPYPHATMAPVGVIVVAISTASTRFSIRWPETLILSVLCAFWQAS